MQKNLLDSFIINVRNLQAEYFTKHKRYFLGLRIPNGKEDGTVDKHIAYGLIPEGENDSWNLFSSYFIIPNI